MNKYIFVFAYFSFAIPFSVFGQDIHFSQYNFTPLLINPAQAGAYKSHEIIVNYKSQWNSIPPHNGYKTMMLSYDGRLMQRKWKTKWLATGVNIFNDRAGDGNMGTLQASVSFGYHTQLNDKNILGGCLMGGFAQRSINYAELTWDEEYFGGPPDPIALASNANFGYPDFGLGILHQFNKGQMYSTANDMIIIHSGVAVTHLNSPQYAFYKDINNSKQTLSPKITGHIDAMIGIKNTNLALMPGMIYMRQGPASEILPGCYFRYMLREQSKFTGFVKGAAILIGTHLRLADAFIPSVQFEMAEYAIGISYDMNISGLKTVTSGKGGFEISLRYGIPNPFLYKSAASFQ